jgi:hypothetical protein|tara:strand:+ start:118 stop:564 length:447 start_codon:yes stop_codon:yes gene_type:complete
MAYTNTQQIWEILEKVSLAKDKKEKVKLLKNYEDWALKDTIRCCYDDTLVFELPPGSPPYTPNRPESTPSSIRRRFKEYSKFIKGGPRVQQKVGAKDPQWKREQDFIGLLESVHPEEALLLIRMKDKVAFNGLTKATVNTAFPNLIKT